jgi:glycosyltransferase involved in cell wall biosynthesis
VGPAVLAYACDLPPALHTLHEPFTDKRRLASGIPDNRHMFEQFHYIKNLYFNGVSKSQLKSSPSGLKRRILGVVHNAVDPNEYIFSIKKKDFFLTVASMSPDKGQGTAARACAELGLKLKMAGTIGGSIDTPEKMREALAHPTEESKNDKFFNYFKNDVVPYLKKGQIEYLGKVVGKEQKKLYSEAKALLFPIDWEEPFGMSVLDALASGTPIIAFNRGAMPEIIKHGYNGFLADNYEEFKNYMLKVGEISPENCHQSVLDNFSTAVMAKQYEKLYRRVIKRYAP